MENVDSYSLDYYFSGFRGRMWTAAQNVSVWLLHQRVQMHEFTRTYWNCGRLLL
uniref:Uncharacterized protein n=1 Tax=Picea sitchensis TaxID=3332 RepID=A9P1G3_PICSI|nr:unknown [Picea sitchensis]